MDDLISRQAAIDALQKEIDKGIPPFDDVMGSIRCGVRLARNIIEDLPSAQPEPSTEIQEILEYLDTILHPIVSPDNWNVYSELHDMVSRLPSAQPERTCVNCGRTVNNGGWYADGRTRCPIEEHYALPKDGFCHLWEKRNVTDDDYPERRTDG